MFKKNETRFVANIRAELSCWVLMACTDILFLHKPVSFCVAI